MSMSDFGKIGSIGCEDNKIFQFFKMAGDAILDFQICEISLADSVWKAQTHHRAKCRLNWSSCCGDIAFFSNFQDGRRSHFEFLKLRNFIVYWGPEGRDA